MPLFFTRRRFLNGRFNDAVDAKTRHLDVTYANALSERWTGAFIDRAAWVDRALARSRNGHVLVFVHGYNTVQRGMVGTLRKLETGLGGKFSGSVVGFDWPSDGDWYAYSWDSKDIEAVADSLVDDCLLPLLKHRKCRSVSVMAHSRGCFLTLRALTRARKLGGTRKLANLMFVSADIRMPDVKLGTAARAHIHRTARRFTNYYSPDDVILQLSQGINGSRPRLGRAGLPNAISPPHSDVRCDHQYRHEHGAGWRPRLSHNWWFSSPGFQRDVSHSLAGKAASALTTRKRIRDSSDHLLWVR